MCSTQMVTLIFYVIQLVQKFGGRNLYVLPFSSSPSSSWQKPISISKQSLQIWVSDPFGHNCYNGWWHGFLCDSNTAKKLVMHSSDAYVCINTNRYGLLCLHNLIHGGCCLVYCICGCCSSWDVWGFLTFACRSTVSWWNYCWLQSSWGMHNLLLVLQAVAR